MTEDRTNNGFWEWFLLFLVALLPLAIVLEENGVRTISDLI